MLAVMRQFTPEELQHARRICDADVAEPEQILRALCLRLGVSVLGVVPIVREDWLFQRAARRLGVARPGLVGEALEREVYVALCRLAWQAAPLGMRQELLRQVRMRWDSGEPPQIEAASDENSSSVDVGFDTVMRYAAGRRAFAAAALAFDLPFPELGRGRGLPLPTLFPRVQDLAPLYALLLLVWRARHRLLVEKQEQVRRLDLQIQRLEQTLAERIQLVRETPIAWYRRPESGAAVAGGVGAAGVIQLALGVASPVTWVLVGLGALWCAIAAAGEHAAAQESPVGRLTRELEVLRSLRQEALAAVRRLQDD